MNRTGLTVLFLILLAGCGKKDDLFLPEQDSAVSTTPAEAQKQDKDKKQSTRVVK